MAADEAKGQPGTIARIEGSWHFLDVEVPGRTNPLRQSLRDDDLEPLEADPKFKAGDRVRVADYASTVPGDTPALSRGYVTPSFFGEEVTVVNQSSNPDRWTVKLDGRDGVNSIHESYLTLVVDEAHVFPQWKPQVGDLVEFTEPTNGRVHRGTVASLYDQEHDDYGFNWNVPAFLTVGSSHVKRGDARLIERPGAKTQPETAPVQASGFTPEQDAEIAKAVEEALAAKKKEFAEIAMKRARLNGEEYVEGLREVFSELDWAVEAQPTRFRGKMTIELEFDIDVKQESAEEAGFIPEDFIRSSLTRYMDEHEGLFDGDISDVHRAYARSVTVTEVTPV
jgi:hypothetical protein